MNTSYLDLLLVQKSEWLVLPILAYLLLLDLDSKKSFFQYLTLMLRMVKVNTEVIRDIEKQKNEH